jgi:transposase-like protein
MKRIRRRYDRDFKISIVAELEGGKPPAQIAREHGIHPAFLLVGERNWPRIPRKRSAAMARGTSMRQGLQSLKGCWVRLMPRTSF